MPNQYTALTRKNILIKLNRKRNPIENASQLAREFGYRTTYRRHDGTTEISFSPKFRNRVIALVGERIWNQIRDEQSVNLSYR